MRITEAQLDTLAHLLRDRVGSEVRPESYGHLRRALGDRLRQKAEGDVERYLSDLAADEAELERLLPLVTIGKTSFFRDAGQFRALGSLLPGLLEAARAEGRRLSIWSAACASGEEVYSIAIQLLEAGVAPAEVEFLATDINPEAIATAARGVYDTSRVEPLSDDLLSRFFLRHETKYAAGAELRAMVSSFRTHNLHADEFPRPESGAWDIIFCRNVLIYFDRDGIRSVASRLHDHLRPGGLLLLGYSESLFKLFDGFELVEEHGSFLYRRPSRPLPATASAAQVDWKAMFEKPPRIRRSIPPAAVPSREKEAPRTSRPPRETPRAPTPRRPLREAIALMEAGAFTEAARCLEAALARGDDALPLRLTLANVYGLLRRHDEAEACFEEALAADPLAPESHLHHGLYLLERSRLPEAEQALARVVYLAPDLALGHYLLGRCHEKLRRAEQARRSYRNALRALDVSQPKLGAYYPDLPQKPEILEAAAKLALAAL